MSENTIEHNEYKEYAEVTWCVEDVIQHARMRDVEITKEQAVEFLEENETVIRESMIRDGWDTLSSLFSDKFK